MQFKLLCIKINLMTFNRNVFRAYDIRGLTECPGAPINYYFAKSLGQVFVKKIKHPKPRIILSRDNRLSSPKLTAGLKAGLATTHCEIFDLGEATSPYFYFCVCTGKFHGGIQITASHNGTEFNGFKLVLENAQPFFGNDLQDLAREMESLSARQPQKVSIWPIDFVEEYYQKLHSACFGVNSTKAKAQTNHLPLKIAIDCGHGIAGRFAPAFFRRAGAEVVELLCEPDGRFPKGVPNPEDHSSLKRLSQKVRKTGVDLGIAFDGDGDRLGAVDSRGQIISAEQILILLARELLARRPRAEIICDLKTSDLVINEIERAGGRTLRHKTGHSFIKQKMHANQSALAGETSGHFFFGADYFGFDDALLAAFKLAKISSHAKTNFCQILDDLPQIFITPDHKITVQDREKFALIEKIAQVCEQEFGTAKISRLDGVYVKLGNREWILVRASNTNPQITLRLEAPSAKRLKQLQKKFNRILQQQVGLSFLKN